MLIDNIEIDYNVERVKITTQIPGIAGGDIYVCNTLTTDEKWNAYIHFRQVYTTPQFKPWISYVPYIGDVQKI